MSTEMIVVKPFVIVADAIKYSSSRAEAVSLIEAAIFQLNQRRETALLEVFRQALDRIG